MPYLQFNLVTILEEKREYVNFYSKQKFCGAFSKATLFLKWQQKKCQANKILLLARGNFGHAAKIWEWLRRTPVSFRKFWCLYGALWRHSENLGDVTENFWHGSENLGTVTEDFVVVPKILASLWNTLPSFRKFWRRCGTLCRHYESFDAAAEDYVVVPKILAPLWKTLASLRKFWHRCGRPWRRSKSFSVAVEHFGVAAENKIASAIPF